MTPEQLEMISTHPEAMHGQAVNHREQVRVSVMVSCVFYT
jgi:uncharacterized protein (DUF433 family)